MASRKYPDINVGYEYKTPKGSILTVKEIDKNGFCTLECSECSKDTELWPYGSIKTKIGEIKCGNCSCGCSKPVKYSSDQWIVRADRAVKDSAFKILSISRNKNGDIKSNCKIKYQCNKHETINEKQPIFNFVNNGPYCDQCRAEETRPDIDKIIHNFHPNTLIKFSKFIPVDRKDAPNNETCWIDCYCDTCAKDEYSINGIGDGWFRKRATMLFNGSAGCRCSSSYAYTKEQREYQIKKILSKEGGEFVGWEDETSKIKTESIFYYKCKSGHDCKNSVDRFVNVGTRCIQCHYENNIGGGSFNVDIPANLYVARFYNEKESFVKVGITNNEISERLEKQKQKAYHVFDYIVLFHLSFEVGQHAWNLERVIKDNFERKYMPRERFRSGFTETFAPRLESDIIIKLKESFNDYKGTIIYQQDKTSIDK